MRFTKSVCFVVLFFLAVAASAAQTDGPFANHYPKDPERSRSSWGYVISFLLPGFDQIYEGQYLAGATYATYAIVGLDMQASAYDRLQTAPGQSDIDARDNNIRQYMLGAQMYQTAGSLSAYQGYRSTIEFYKNLGTSYSFIKSDDKVSDIAWAPFDFRFLARPTTFIPLAVLLGVSAISIHNTSNADYYINGSDMGYTAGFSVQAGVGEETLFRGILMPELRESFRSDLWSNVVQAGAFGALHISSENKFPIAQAAVGYYLGWLTQQNNWSIRENVFIHAWWDVIAFTAGYLAQTKAERKVYLPIISATY